MCLFVLSLFLWSIFSILSRTNMGWFVVADLVVRRDHSVTFTIDLY